MNANLDLFGNPVNDQPTSAPTAAPRVNDMDLVQAVLADVVDEKSPALHRDEAGHVTRCRIHGTAAVTDEEAAVVNQLLAARYLSTARRGRCTAVDHGPAITATPAGRNAHHRWGAYQRPASWGPCGGRATVGHGGPDTGLTAGPTTPSAQSDQFEETR